MFDLCNICYLLHTTSVVPLTSFWSLRIIRYWHFLTRCIYSQPIYQYCVTIFQCFLAATGLIILLRPRFRPLKILCNQNPISIFTILMKSSITKTKWIPLRLFINCPKRINLHHSSMKMMYSIPILSLRSQNHKRLFEIICPCKSSCLAYTQYVFFACR